MSGRRAFTTAAIGSLIGLRVRAATKSYRIGVFYDDSPDEAAWNEFVAELARRGYVEGQNLKFEKRFSIPPTQLDAVAKELVGQRVDLIFVLGGTANVLAMQRATSSIPVVFYGVADPVGSHLVSSLGRPGGNLTGSSAQMFDLAAKRLQYLSEAAGGLKSFALIINSKVRQAPTFPQWTATFNTASAALRIRIQFVDVESFAELEPALKRLLLAGVDGVSVLGDAFPNDDEVAAIFVRYKLPSIGAPSSGFLLNLDYAEGLFLRTAAKYIDKILKGSKPAELPVEQHVPELVINLRTAKALGLNIPRSLLLRADKVIPL